MVYVCLIGQRETKVPFAARRGCVKKDFARTPHRDRRHMRFALCVYIIRSPYVELAVYSFSLLWRASALKRWRENCFHNWRLKWENDVCWNSKCPRSFTNIVSWKHFVSFVENQSA